LVATAVTVPSGYADVGAPPEAASFN
jgi:hypothetical protein